jgi:hypothetical protein
MAGLGPGHNGGPSLDPGGAWRLHCWRKARADLLPHLPLEVLRGRVRRAAELGLDYRTYASVRAATGHDVVAFLFSSNALRVLQPGAALPPDRHDRLIQIAGCTRIGLAAARLTPADLAAAAGPALDATHPAPPPLGRFPEIATALRAAAGRIPRDRILLVGDTALERDWCAAGRLAFYLPADRYFP